MEFEIINGTPKPETSSFINALHKFKKAELAIISSAVSLNKVGKKVIKNTPIETTIIYQHG